VQGIPPHPSGHALAPEGVSGGKRRDLSCGHCCLRTSSWAEMCAHLNQPGMEQEDPYQPRSPLGEAPLRLLPAPIPHLCRLRFLGMLTPLGCTTTALRVCVTHRVPHLGGKLQVSHPRRWQHPASSVKLCCARRLRRASLRFPSPVLPGVQ